jgi:D-sedoheptulose 7-phosphate isomerase
MLEQRIQQQFFEGADLQYQAAETLSRPVAEAAQALMTAITAGGKVLVGGNGGAFALALHAVAQLLGRFERERPPLAALALQPLGENPTVSLVQQLRALAQPGDVFLAIDGQGDVALLIAAVQAAAEREATVVLISSAAEPTWRELLGETDVLVAVPAGRRARVVEMQLLVLNCLCDALDVQLLGDQES